MKIIYGTDLHGDFDPMLKLLKQFAEERKADIVVISGDLIDMAYTSVEEIEAHKTLIEPMLQITDHNLTEISKTKKIDISPSEFFKCVPITATQLIENKSVPKEIKDVAKAYINNLYNAQNFMEMQYAVINAMFPQALALPGNYDMDLDDTELKDKNLHKQTRKVGGVVLAGYGGAVTPEGMPLCPPTIPLELTVACNEYTKNDKLHSEPWAFLDEAKPTIAFTHMPPHGYCDRKKVKDEKGEEHEIETGSFGLQEYAESGISEVICCGHIHEAKGVKKVRTKNEKFTAVINPGNLGNDDQNNGGNFVEIDIENGKFVKATLYEIINPKDDKSLFIVSSHIRTDKDGVAELLINKPFYY